MIIILGGGYYSYTKGWLDGPIRGFLGTQQEDTGLISATEPPASQAQTQQAKQFPDSSPGTVTQLEAFQGRLNNQESSLRNLQAIIEDIADKVARQSGDVSAPASNTDFMKLRLEIIDLRLRLTGNTLDAMRSLESMEFETDPESIIGITIRENRQRLAQIPARNHLLGLFDRLEDQAARKVADVERRLLELEAENQKASTDGGLLNALFKVKKTDRALLLESGLSQDLLSEIPEARNALLLDRDTYLAALEEIQDAASALSSQVPSLETTEIARLLAELREAGYPAYHLELIGEEG